MPTGYTADVADGKVTDFRTFALRCSRAFGACIMQRDDAPDDPPKHREPSDHSAKALVTARERLAELKAMTATEIVTVAAQSYMDALKSYNEYEAEKAVKRERYHTMLARVQTWTPPTGDHVGFLGFMVQQLQESIRFDCSEGTPPAPLGPAEWYAKEIHDAEWSVTYHEKEDAAEKKRCAESNKWIDDLLASLPVPS